MNTKLLGVVAALVLGMTSSHATVITVTYQGTVSASHDGLGLFGPAGGNVNGQSFIFTSQFDTSLGPNNQYLSGPSNYINGGSVFGNVSPTLGGVLKIGNGEAEISGEYLGSLLSYNNGTFSEHTVTLNGEDINWYINAKISNNDASLPNRITTPFTHIVGPGDTTLGGFQFIDTSFFGPLSYSLGTFNLTSLTVAEVGVAQTPLPAALPLFATVLAGGGLIAWRRKRKAAKVAA